MTPSTPDLTAPFKFARNMARTFVSAVLAGMMISIGGIVFLSVGNGFMGAFLFGLGLFSVVSYGFALFTGRIGYLFDNPPTYAAELCAIWLGNLCGSLAVGSLIAFAKPSIAEKASAIVELKLENELLPIFILSVFCGMLMFIAVDLYKRLENPVGKCLAIFLPVMVFILSGFEHCVANMFYFTAAGAWSVHTLFLILVMTLGNSIGGIAIPLLLRLSCVKKAQDNVHKDI